jgi:hypothetical protein
MCKFFRFFMNFVSSCASYVHEKLIYTSFIKKLYTQDLLTKFNNDNERSKSSLKNFLCLLS